MFLRPRKREIYMVKSFQCALKIWIASIVLGHSDKSTLYPGKREIARYLPNIFRFILANLLVVEMHVITIKCRGTFYTYNSYSTTNYCCIIPNLWNWILTIAFSWNVVTAAKIPRILIHSSKTTHIRSQLHMLWKQR